MMNRTTLVIICLPALLAGCTWTSRIDVPDNLKPAAGEALQSVLAARGVQIYECRAKKDTPSATEWAFVAPEAQLFDGAKLVGKHYAGPHWEANDGSKIVGAVKARADAPQAGAIPWLLLTTKSDGPAGTFSKVSSVQRVSTVGGIAPAEGCNSAAIGKVVRVPYTADYRFFAAQ
jgi:hypothetical protein